MKKKSTKWTEDKVISKDRCYECNSNENIHYHHIIPFILGGNNTIPLCVICHGKVHDHNFIKLKNLMKLGKEKKVKIKKPNQKIKKNEITIIKRKISLDTTISQKQKLSNVINGIEIKNETIRKILESKEFLKNNNQKITQKKISQISGLSLISVKRYYRYDSIVNINEILNDYGLDNIPFENVIKTIVPRKDKVTYKRKEI
jgi:hypothetical protein